MRNTIALASVYLTISLSLSPISASAQVAPSQGASQTASAYASENPIMAGSLDGRIAAQGRGTGGYFIGGFVGGVTLGLIGTGIVWGVAAASDPAPSQTQSLLIRKQGSEYAIAYNEAFSTRLKQRRKRKAVTGGLIGTGVLVAILLSSY